MSRNVTPSPSSLRTPTRKPDRRVRQTRETLGDALVNLMHEKPFEEITVQHILDRAGVSRSTFYTHFSDKNDLFLSDVEEFFEMMAFALSRHKDTFRRIAPVREMFTHLAESRPLFDAMVAAEKIQDVMEIGQGCFARGIDQRLAELAAAKTNGTGSAPGTRAMARSASTAVAQMLAGALTSLMTWWIHSDKTLSPAQMDDLYHDMAWAGVGGVAARHPKT
jgi:AcrR family transcriptional regulator